MMGVLLLFVVLVVNGAVPGLMSPTTAQLFWSTGFSKSFANHGLSIFATNFGLPEPAAIAFGLAAAWPVGVFIKLGVHPIEAYNLVFALWLTLAFLGAYSLVRLLGGDRNIALISAAIWGTMPVIWQHHPFGMVALGMALLPFYVNASMRLIRGDSIGFRIPALFVVACVIALFMDGYSYMMFAVSTAIIGMVTLIERRQTWHSITLARFPVAAAGFAASYLLYVSYLGKDGFDGSTLEFFRGWGASLEFLVVATKGILFLPDLVGLSDERSVAEYFGDASTYISTFAFPVALAAVVCLAARAGKLSDRIIFALIALVGFYMCLGPSFKFLTYRPVGVSQLMPAEYGLGPTGTGWFSEHLPGFKNMRASYRWVALGIFGSWALLSMTTIRRDTRRIMVPCLVAVALFNVPTLKALSQSVKYRTMAYAIDAEVEQMRPYFNPSETVAMLPYRNDFLANYIAARLNLKAYNIGGDKNLGEARKHWPRTMRRFEEGVIDDQYPRNVAAILENEDVDAVMLPYFDLLEAAHVWPYQKKYEPEMAAIAAKLYGNPRFSVTFSEEFAVVRLNDGLKGLGDTALVPLAIDSNELLVSSTTTDPNVFSAGGWYSLEPAGIWSKGNSTLLINVKKASGTPTDIHLTFTPYTPQPDDKMTVKITSHGRVVVNQEFVGQTPNVTAAIPLSPDMIDEKGDVQLSIETHPLHSPLEAGIQDGRELGIMLHSASLKVVN